MPTNLSFRAAVFAALVLFLSGCTRRPMTFEEARPKFQAGMASAEVQRIFGPPMAKNGGTWLYSPAERLEGRPGTINGFQIVFLADAAMEIRVLPYTRKN